MHRDAWSGPDVAREPALSSAPAHEGGPAAGATVAPGTHRGPVIRARMPTNPYGRASRGTCGLENSAADRPAGDVIAAGPTAIESRHVELGGRRLATRFPVRSHHRGISTACRRRRSRPACSSWERHRDAAGTRSAAAIRSVLGRSAPSCELSLGARSCAALAGWHTRLAAAVPGGWLGMVARKWRGRDYDSRLLARRSRGPAGSGRIGAVRGRAPPESRVAHSSRNARPTTQLVECGAGVASLERLMTVMTRHETTTSKPQATWHRPRLSRRTPGRTEQPVRRERSARDRHARCLRAWTPEP